MVDLKRLKGLSIAWSGRIYSFDQGEGPHLQRFLKVEVPELVDLVEDARKLLRMYRGGGEDRRIVEWLARTDAQWTEVLK